MVKNLNFLMILPLNEKQLKIWQTRLWQIIKRIENYMHRLKEKCEKLLIYLILRTMAKYKAINSEDPKLLGENVEIDSIDTNEPTKVVIG